MDCDTCQGCGKFPEQKSIREAQNATAYMAQFTRTTTRINIFLSCVVAVLIMAVIILSCCLAGQAARLDTAMADAMAKNQEAINAGLLEALNTVAEMEYAEDSSVTTTTTTTQTAEGSGVTFNNVDGNQFNDSSQQQNGGAE